MNRRWLLPLVGALAVAAAILVVWNPGGIERGEVVDFEAPGREHEDAAAETRTSGAVHLGGSGHEAPRRETLPDGHGAIEGIVVDMSRAPVTGVPVRVEEALAYWRPSLLEFDAPSAGHADRVAFRETHSDADGRYRFEGLACGLRYRLLARPADGRHGSSTVAMPEPWTTPRVVLLVGGGHEVRGRVVDLSGSGTRAWVMATEPISTDDTRRYAGTFSPDPVPTEADGRFVLTGIPAGRILLGALVPGERARNFVPIEVPVSEEVVIRLGEPGGAAIAGTIQDAESRPVRGALVCAVVTTFTGGHLKERTEAMVVTEANGAFRLEGLLPGRVQNIHVDAEGYLAQPFLGHDLRLRAGQTLPFDVTLVEGRTLAGRVEDEAGEGVGGATLTLTPVGVPGEIPPRPPSYEVTSDAEGRFQLGGLPLLSFDVAATCPGYAMLPVERVPLHGASEASQVVVRLKRLPDAIDQIRGRALDADGAPVPGTVVSAVVGRDYVSPDGRRPSITRPCDADGSFVLEGLQAAKWWRVMATAPEHGSAAVEALAAPLGTPTAEEVVLTLEPRVVCTGRVVGPEGEPFAGLRVRAEAAGCSPLYAIGAFDGGFRLGGMAAGETWTVYATDEFGTTVSDRVEVEARADAPEIVLRVREVHLLGGTVVDDAGQPVELQMVKLGHLKGHSGPTPFTYSDAAGAFLFRLFQAGEHTLSFGFEVLPGTYATGRTDHVLVTRAQEEQADARRFVDVTLLGPDGRKVERGVVWFRTGDDGRGRRNSGSGARAGGGHFHTLLEPHATDFDLEVVATLDAAGRRLDHAPLYVRNLDPDDSPFTFSLRPGGDVVGRVVDEAGAGLPGVEVIVGPPLSPHEVNWHRMGRHSPHSVRTDAEGHFRQVGLAEGTASVSVLTPAEWVAPGRIDAVVDGQEVVVVLEPAAALRGRILDPAGAAVANVDLSARLTRASRSAWSDVSSEPAFVRNGWRTRSAADGTFALRGIPASARLDLKVRPPSPWSEQTLTDVGAGGTGLVIRLGAGAFVEGEIAGEDWEAVGNLTVRAYAPRPEDSSTHRGLPRASVRVAGGGGPFRLGPLEPGVYDLVVEGKQARREIVSLAEVRAPCTGLRIELPVARHVRGRILGDDLKGLRISVYWGDGSSTSTSTDGSGLFFFASTRAGSATLVVLEEEGARYGLLEDVDPKDGPFEMTLRRGEAIAGRVEGLPADFGRQFQVAVRGKQVWKQGRGEADGSFRVDGLPPGNYAVDVDTGLPRGSFRLEEIRVGTSDLRLQYPR